MTKRFIGVAALLLLLLGAGFQAVSTYAQATGPDVGTAGSLTSTYRIVNADPTAPGVLPQVDGVLSTKIIIPADYATKPISGYDSVVGAAAPGASHTVTLINGTTNAAFGTPLAFNFVAQSDYTFAIMPDTSWVTFTDSKVMPPTGMVSVRFINLTTDSAALSLSINGSVPTGLGGIASKGASPYVTMAIGSYPVVLMNGSTVVYTLPHPNPFPFQAYHVYTIFAMGTPGSEKLEVGTDANFTSAVLTQTPGAVTTTPVVGTPSPTGTPPVIGNPIRFFLPLIDNGR
jgi:hypothetical protein